MQAGKMTDDRITLQGHEIPYEVRHSDRASRARIDVRVSGVTVVIPRGSYLNPEDVLSRKAGWVREKYAAVEAYREQIPERRFEEGATFPFHGEPHTVRIHPGRSHQVHDGELQLARSAVAHSSVQTSLRSLLRSEARDFFERTADRYAEQLGVAYNTIRVKNQRTRWGSCSSRGNLNLNWRLIMAPQHVSTYVVAHEVCHLREPNHSPAFWELVEDVFPAYQDAVDWLDANRQELVFTDDDI